MRWPYSKKRFWVQLWVTCGQMLLHSCYPCQEQHHSVPGMYAANLRAARITRWGCLFLEGQCGTATSKRVPRLRWDRTHVCASDTVDGYCVVLLGNQRVTVWRNCGYEHVRHSLWPYRKEKRGHRSRTRGRRRGECMKAMSPLSPFGPQPSFLSTSSHTQSPALAPRHFPVPNNSSR